MASHQNSAMQVSLWKCIQIRIAHNVLLYKYVLLDNLKKPRKKFKERLSQEFDLAVNSASAQTGID